MGLLRQIIKDTAIISTSNTASFFLGFFTFIITAKELGPYQFGIFSLAISILSIITIAIDLGIGKLVVSESAKPEKIGKNILGAYALTQIMITSILGFLIIIFSSNIAVAVGKEIQSLLILLGVLTFLAGVKNIIITALQSENRFKDYGKFIFFDSLIRFFSVLFFVYYFEKKAEYVLLGYVVTEVIVLMLYKKSIPKNTELEHLNPLFTILKQQGKWVFVTSIIRSIETNLSLWIIQTVIGTTATGAYAAILRIQTSMLRIFEPLETILYPLVSRVYKNENSEKIIYRATKYLFYLSLPITAFYFIFPEFVISVTIGQEFTNNADLLRLLILILPLFIINSPQKPFLFTMRAQKELTVIALTLLVFTSFFGTIAVLYLGLFGIALSEIIKAIIDFTLKSTALRKYSERKFNLKDLTLPDKTDLDLLKKISTQYKK